MLDEDDYKGYMNDKTKAEPRNQYDVDVEGLRRDCEKKRGKGNESRQMDREKLVTRIKMETEIHTNR